MDSFQFYVTPAWLVHKAWATFINRDFKRVLEPAAGTGELAKPAVPEQRGLCRSRSADQVDVIEIDVSKHPILREAGLNVVGLDFHQFEGGAAYSHVIANPPFSQGAAFLLKAWDMLWTGEIVMIINAETVRNPFSADRKRIVDLIAKHGSVEFIADAFVGPDVVRQADVEIALVHLVKPAREAADWVGPMIKSLAVEPDAPDEFALPNELMLPQSFVETQVAAFRAAVRAMRESVKAEAVAAHYSARIGRTMAELNGKAPPPEMAAFRAAARARRDGSARAGRTTPDRDGAPTTEADSNEQRTGDAIRDAYSARYDDLKDRSWSSILRSTETLSRLSSKVQKQVESSFQEIKRLEFTTTTVRGFLCGLVDNQSDMQIQMCVDTFLQISQYWSENTCFYRSWAWKSNDKHRTCGWRLRTTRFILPGFGTESYYSSLGWEQQRRLADFDLVWALLDGKREPEMGLVDLFKSRFAELKAGQRLSSDYFEVRYFRQRGSIHFFPRDKTLVDRLNRLVGRHRAWLPPNDSQASDAFWKAYNGAEKFDADVQDELTKLRHASDRHRRWWDHPCRALMHGSSEESERAAEIMATAVDTALQKHGLLEAITHDPASNSSRAEGGAQRNPQGLLLLTAA
jgi:hypothetical protein